MVFWCSGEVLWFCENDEGLGEYCLYDFGWQCGLVGVCLLVLEFVFNGLILDSYFDFVDGQCLSFWYFFDDDLIWVF